ncbi:MAG: hypothetical protein ABL962_21900 [Fimbriimonadaceae bacterium]
MKIVNLATYERDLEGRKAALGFSGRNYVRPNAGGRRTRAKRNLLRAIAEFCRLNGRRPRFSAHL